jgi:hypothetical protein
MHNKFKPRNFSKNFCLAVGLVILLVVCYWHKNAR